MLILSFEHVNESLLSSVNRVSLVVQAKSNVFQRETLRNIGLQTVLDKKKKIELQNDLQMPNAPNNCKPSQASHSTLVRLTFQVNRTLSKMFSLLVALEIALCTILASRLDHFWREKSFESTRRSIEFSLVWSWSHKQSENIWFLHHLSDVEKSKSFHEMK